MKGRIIVDIEEIPEDCYQCDQPDECGYCHWVGKYIDHCGEIGKKHPLCPIEPWEGGKIMDAVEYLKAKARMTEKGASYACNIFCENCPIGIENNRTDMNCKRFEAYYPERAVEIVEKWAAEHPKKTRQSEFLKMFPRVPMKNGLLLTNPCWVDSTVKCLKQKSDGVYEDAPEKCVECRRKYWLVEVE